MQLFRHVDLSGNHLVSLPPDIQYLVSVSELNLDSNELMELPEEMSKLQSLTVLSLKDNSILVCVCVHVHASTFDPIDL